VFLDILLEDETGFDFLNALENIKFSVVFTTAYEKYALKAFQYSALDYLLKPIDEVELKNVIKKLQSIQDKNSLKVRLENFIKTYKTGTYPSQLALNSKNEIEFVKLDEILFCEADGFYTKFYLDNSREILVCKNIKEYENLLPSYNLFRIHKSYLVNRFKIKKIIKKDGGYVLMSNGKSLPISQRKKEQFMEYVLKNI
jgi:two-component system LytT family response regulator